MLRVDRAAGSVTVVSRLARAPAVAVLAALLLAAAVAARASVAVAAPLVLAAALVVLLGARPVRARFAGGRVLVRSAPCRRVERPLSDFSGARVETMADVRQRKAERLARGYRERSGGAEMPSWIVPPRTPGTNDQLRRVVLVAWHGEPFEVTAWLADDLEPVRAEVEGLLR